MFMEEISSVLAFYTPKHDTLAIKKKKDLLCFIPYLTG